MALCFQLLQRPPRRFLLGMRDSAIRDVVTAELLLREPLDPRRLNGCGLLVINPPFGFAEAAAPMLDALRDRLGSREAGEASAISRITDE